MNDYRQAFKRHIEFVAFQLKISYGEFRASRGIDDFLIEMSMHDWTPQEAAAKALDVLCKRDKGSMDRAVCVAVVYFLDETVGAPRQDPTMRQRLKDLEQVLTGPGHPQAGLQWVNTWYS